MSAYEKTYNNLCQQRLVFEQEEEGGFFDRMKHLSKEVWPVQEAERMDK